MGYLELAEQIKDFIRKQRSPRTAEEYIKLLKAFCLATDADSVDKINEWIPAHLKTHYALRWYLLATGREDDVKLLVKPKGYNRKPKIEGSYLTQDEQKRLISLLPEPYKMIATVQYLTGARAGDVTSIRKDSIERVTDIEGVGLRILIVGKGGRERNVWIPTEYSSYIAGFIEAATATYPFLGANDAPLAQVKLIYNRYRDALIKAAKEVKPAFRTHDFRRNFVNDSYTKFKDLRVVKDLVGHAEYSTTMKYIKKRLDKEEYIKAVRELGR